MNKLIDWAKAHPKLSMWTVLGLGMAAIIAYEARDVGLLVGQWAALIIATVLVAGLCVWIIGWEDDEDEVELGSEAVKQTTTTTEEKSQPKKNKN